MLRVQGFSLGVIGLWVQGFRVYGVEFRVSGSLGYKVLDLRLRV